MQQKLVPPKIKKIKASKVSCTMVKNQTKIQEKVWDIQQTEIFIFLFKNYHRTLSLLSICIFFLGIFRVSLKKLEQSAIPMISDLTKNQMLPSHIFNRPFKLEKKTLSMYTYRLALFLIVRK